MCYTLYDAWSVGWVMHSTNQGVMILKGDSYPAETKH